MKYQFPRTFKELTEEIMRVTGLPQNETEHRIWMEALQRGWNVALDVERFGVIPHKHDQGMEKLYREGSGFIFETLLVWATPERHQWTFIASDRIRRYCEKRNLQSDVIKILTLGDGVGSDSLYLASQGYRVDYFDVPGSKTMDFAFKRFAYYPDLKNRIQVVTDYASCLSAQYDVVISFEVLEHLPQPLEAITDISRMLRPGGIALITESFGSANRHLPTHLSSNLRYAGRTPFLFLKHNLVLSWYASDPLFKPSEYLKVENRSSEEWLKLVRDRCIWREWLVARARNLKRAMFD